MSEPISQIVDEVMTATTVEPATARAWAAAARTGAVRRRRRTVVATAAASVLLLGGTALAVADGPSRQTLRPAETAPTAPGPSPTATFVVHAARQTAGFSSGSSGWFADGPHVWTTEDAGATWTPVPGSFGEAVQDVRRDGADVRVLAADAEHGTVLYRTSGGTVTSADVGGGAVEARFADPTGTWVEVTERAGTDASTQFDSYLGAPGLDGSAAPVGPLHGAGATVIGATAWMGGIAGAVYRRPVAGGDWQTVLVPRGPGLGALAEEGLSPPVAVGTALWVVETDREATRFLRSDDDGATWLAAYRTDPDSLFQPGYTGTGLSGTVTLRSVSQRGDRLVEVDTTTGAGRSPSLAGLPTGQDLGSISFSGSHGWLRVSCINNGVCTEGWYTTADGGRTWGRLVTPA